MADGWMARRLAALVAAGLLCGVVLVGSAHAQGPDELAAMLAEVNRLHREGKYADAISIAERAVTLARERHSEEHVEFAAAMARLGKLYFDQGRFSEAEPLIKRSLAVREKALGPEHFDVATLLFDLAMLYGRQGRNEEAMRLMKRGGDIVSKSTAALMNSEEIKKVRRFDTRDRDAETIIRRRLAEDEQKFGLDHPKLDPTCSGPCSVNVRWSSATFFRGAHKSWRRLLSIVELAKSPTCSYSSATLAPGYRAWLPTDLPRIGFSDGAPPDCRSRTRASPSNCPRSRSYARPGRVRATTRWRQ